MDGFSGTFSGEGEGVDVNVFISALLHEAAANGLLTNKQTASDEDGICFDGFHECVEMEWVQHGYEKMKYDNEVPLVLVFMCSRDHVFMCSCDCVFMCSRDRVFMCSCDCVFMCSRDRVFMCYRVFM